MTDKKVKYVGFEVTGSIRNILKIMLISIVDYTIPKSFCHIYYQNRLGNIVNKSFFNDSGEGFFINGYM